MEEDNTRHSCIFSKDLEAKLCVYSTIHNEEICDSARRGIEKFLEIEEIKKDCADGVVKDTRVCERAEL
jgi:hypothetical protein